MDQEELNEAVKLVNSAIAEGESRLRGDDDSHIIVDEETETGYYCQIQVDAKKVAEVYLRYDYPIYRILGQEVLDSMWIELARMFGLSSVDSVDYILTLVTKYHESNCENKDILVSIDKAVDASIELRSKKQLIHDFINLYPLKENTEIHDAWQKFINAERNNELQKIIDDNNLNPEETKRLIVNSFRDGTIKTTGTDVDRIMPAISRFGGERTAKKKSVVARLVEFFEKYFGAI